MRARLCVSAFGLAVVLALLAPGQAVAQPTAAGTSQPLTPAAIVLFTETASLPGTQTLMTAALTDPNPYLRRVAARVARVTHSVAQRPALERALTTEPSSAEPGTPRVRLFPWIVPGLGRDVLKATGCKLPRDLPYIASHVTYTPTGRIAQAALESPVYPETAQSERVQGVVILDALITPEGCVSELGVRRSVHSQLDFAALRAAMGWRYTPTILEAVPVPVIMTVTVSFTLQP
jgi:TonB family protein